MSTARGLKVIKNNVNKNTGHVGALLLDAAYCCRCGLVCVFLRLSVYRLQP